VVNTVLKSDQNGIEMGSSEYLSWSSFS